MTSSPLLKIFEAQIIPWVEQFGTANIALAQPSWEQWQAADSIPEGISGRPHPLLSQRQAVKGRRSYGNTALVDACWPKDNLQSSRAPLLAFVLNGAVAFPLGGYRLHCRPGHGILVPPGVAHSNGTHLYLDESVPGNKACELLILRPYNGAMACWLSHTRDNQHWSHRSPEESCCIANNQCVFYLETLTTEMLGRAQHHRQVGGGLLTALVHLMGRELQKIAPAMHAVPPLEHPTYGANSDAISIAQEYICSHLSEPLALDNVARYVYTSRRLFTEQFRRKTGQTFQEYLNDRRFEEASNLLVKTDWSIKVIGDFVGLKPSRLRSLFHQRLKMSPTAYRHSKKCPITLTDA